ncbi:MAG: histidine--tRNA ligase [Gammaproteobacteria bacterium]|nr:histidine--tRNA ligase [Gammaproteobacteria bacterium]
MANPPIQAIRGMNDILPEETIYWQFVEKILRDTLQSYGYQEIRFPILEKTELFKRSIGDATDIVEKEMYTFFDRNNESLTLRPEGTASCVRLGNEHGLLYNQIQRLWSLGPYFRYERPQKGRYRQFHQCDVEVFGLEGPDIDAEIILLTAKILEKLGLKSYVTLQLNSLGAVTARQHYREKLVDYFSTYQEQLDEDSRRRLVTNPLRILDSKNPAMQHLIENAPRLIDYLDAESQQHFEKLQDFLTSTGVAFTINPRLVRGLDYYTKTVFEWVTSELGAQGTVCAGGRYDSLVEQLGGKSTPAIGFALGMERTILLVQQLQKNLHHHLAPHIYIISDSNATLKKAMQTADFLRDQLSDIRVIVNCGDGSFKNQFKKADKSGAQLALIIGEQELKTETITIKFLREKTDQITGKSFDILNLIKQKIFKTRDIDLIK